MRPEAQRIAIAQACGWRLHWSGFKLPDYLTDLNAMHEAEKVLIAMGDDNCDGYGTSTFHCYLHRISKCATAAERAEAFLRTIDRWEESA